MRMVKKQTVSFWAFIGGRYLKIESEIVIVMYNTTLCLIHNLSISLFFLFSGLFESSKRWLDLSDNLKQKGRFLKKQKKKLAVRLSVLWNWDFTYLVCPLICKSISWATSVNALRLKSNVSVSSVSKAWFLAAVLFCWPNQLLFLQKKWPVVSAQSCAQSLT